MFFKLYCIFHWWFLSVSPWDHMESWGRGSGVLLDLHAVIFFKKLWDHIICRCFPLGKKKLIRPNRWCVSALNREHQLYEINFLKNHGKYINFHQSNWINLCKDVIQGIIALHMACLYFFQNNTNKLLYIFKTYLYMQQIQLWGLYIYCQYCNNICWVLASLWFEINTDVLSWFNGNIY